MKLLMSLGAALIVAAVALNAPSPTTTRLAAKPAAMPVIVVPPLRAAGALRRDGVARGGEDRRVAR